MSTLQAGWSHGEITVDAVAGMLTDLVFRLDGRLFRPLARAPWLDDATSATLSATSMSHVDVLGGEFPCVPFGAEHGYAANAEWSMQSDDDGIRAWIDYPQGCAIRRLSRSIRPTRGRPEVRFELTIDARENAVLPIGVHPILRLPAHPESLEIRAAFDRGFTHPSPAAPHHVTSHDEEFADLAEVPGPVGPVDLTRLPLRSHVDPDTARAGVDDGGMLCGARSPVTVIYRHEQAELTLDWDDAVLPSLNYWYSDRGLADAPWNGRYRGLGLEPACAYFDYGLKRSIAPNSLASHGIATSLAVAAGTELTIAYSLAARSQTPAMERTSDAD
jgi:hypothetical protein